MSYEPVDEKFFSQIAKEIELNQIDKGLFAQAISISNGDQKVVESHYIKLRVQKLKREFLKNEEIINSQAAKLREEEIHKQFKVYFQVIIGAIFWGGVLILFFFAKS